MNYDEAVKFIKECAKFGVKLGLERIGEILKRLGNPEKRFRSVHIAGTNGKGSTAAMFDSVFREAGYKTGRFTSPHLVSYRERFTVNGVWISTNQLSEIISKVKPVLEAVSRDGFGNPTEFEIGTVLAFEFFAAQAVDVAVIEVGMGGRFDATNVIAPILSVITRIDYDHQQYLGNSLPEIAFEKAGIIKPGIPVVIGLQLPEIETYLSQITTSRGSKFKLATDIMIESVKVTENGTESLYQQTYFGPLKVDLRLIGPHQAVNCLNVLAGMEPLTNAGFKITQSALLNGLAKAVWPCRMERIERIKPLKLYLDGAHNPDGARALVGTIKLLYPGQRVDMLVGILENKSYGEMVAIFSEIAATVIVTGIPGFKAVPCPELAAIFTSYGIAAISEPDSHEALTRLMASSNTVAVAAGSLYLMGELRSILFPELT
jgi:dihydrofolate synthase/folylpolyglutamate synthase